MRFVLSLILAVAFTWTAEAAGEIRVEVDARDISRALLHARVELPATAGAMVVWYPKWIPGVHAPGGPAQNIGGLRFETLAGAVIPWKRDEEELNRFHLEVPAGTERVVAHLDYICNQPSVNSSGVDSFGTSLLGVINWNTVLLYPEGANIDTTMATVTLRCPEGWKWGTALPGGKAAEGTVRFAAASLRQVVDCPLIMGENFRTIDLSPTHGGRKAFLHLTSEAGSAIQISEELIGKFRKLVAESLALFGGARWEEYHFLVVCSDFLPRNGLEHLTSSFNEVAERELVDEKKFKSWPVYLLPHEFVHAWCGKFRRPAAMLTKNFHTPERTKLLWVYEGLTQYLGEVLTVRSGLYKFEENLPQLADKVDFLRRQQGRMWRSLEDTATASWQLRQHSVAWPQLRRGQDYYDEGLLVWLEADALIRQKTGEQASLDDFCRKFFAVADGETRAVSPYELTEVIAALNAVAPHDWAGFFAERVQRPRAQLGLEFLQNLGYRLQFSPKPSQYFVDQETDRKRVGLMDSLGISVAEDGKIMSVVPGSVADGAKLAYGQKVAAVNGRKFSTQRMKDAVADSPTRGQVELMIEDGDRFTAVTVPYKDGPRYLELVRDPGQPDRLAKILQGLVK